ncbi:hypothetical protein CPB86DRAFT_281931 [Serendipita vermifera]|nr:hypothetical protein CPB86DRAFT_281931 [Serendipita vermifera]
MADSTISSVHRTPLEIWRAILIYVISSPTLPSAEDGLIDSIRLLEHDCERSQRSERIRTRLQLVCSAWNELLKPRINQLEYWRGYAPPAITFSCSRVEFMENDPYPRRKCECPQSNSPAQSPKEASSPSTQYPSVDAFVNEDKSQTIEEILYMFPNLRVFSNHVWDWNLYQRVDTACFSAPLFHISHLHLPPTWVPNEDMTVISLPSLHTLSIGFPRKPVDYGLFLNTRTPPPRLCFRHWSLPNLINLAFSGYSGRAYITRPFVHLVLG